MITLKFAQPTNESQQIEERLKELSLAYKTETSISSKQVELTDGTTNVQGHEAIQNYLDQLSGELNQWYYCAC
jgi:hypothetical protein